MPCYRLKSDLQNIFASRNLVTVLIMSRARVQAHNFCDFGLQHSVLVLARDLRPTPFAALEPCRATRVAANSTFL